MAPPKQIRVMCVDDHAFLVEGLHARFSMEPDLICAGRLASADNLVNEVKHAGAEIVLMDIEMPGPDTFEAIADLKRCNEDARVILLSAHIRDHYINAAYRAGAWGYFCKSDDMDDIIKGIRKVAAGEFALGQKVQQRCRMFKGRPSADDPKLQSKLELLTDRELEVLRMIGRGKSRGEIAQLLSRSAKTIDGHREAIMKKLDIHDRGELVRYAIREGLVEA